MKKECINFSGNFVNASKKYYFLIHHMNTGFEAYNKNDQLMGTNIFCMLTDIIISNGKLPVSMEGKRHGNRFFMPFFRDRCSDQRMDRKLDNHI